MSEGGAPGRDLLRGLHVSFGSFCWTSACHRPLGLPSPQALSSLCPQQHLAFLTILIWTPPRLKLLASRTPTPPLGSWGLSSFSDHLSVFSVCAALLGASWETCPLAFPCPPGNCPLSAQSRILMASLPSLQGLRPASSCTFPCWKNSQTQRTFPEECLVSSILLGVESTTRHGRAAVGPVWSWPRCRECPGGRPGCRLTPPGCWGGSPDTKHLTGAPSETFKAQGGGSGHPRLCVPPGFSGETGPIKCL